jgi:hypothetical protein
LGAAPKFLTPFVRYQQQNKIQNILFIHLHLLFLGIPLFCVSHFALIGILGLSQHIHLLVSKPYKPTFMRILDVFKHISPFPLKEG